MLVRFKQEDGSQNVVATSSVTVTIWLLRKSLLLRYRFTVAYEARGGAAVPRLDKFRANAVFRASSSCSKILKDKKYFNTAKSFRADSVFQGKCRLFKILNDTKLRIQYSEFKAHSVFQGKHKLLKHPECKKYIKYSKKFHDKLCFQGKRKFLKNLKEKNISMQCKISGQTLFFRACASCLNSEC